MKSRTIGSGGDDADIPTWEAQIDDSDDETGTCIQSADLGIAVLNPASTGRAYLLTANDANKVNAPTWAAMTGKARIERGTNGIALQITGTSWTVEKIAFVATGGTDTNGLLTNATCAIRRCGANGLGTGTGIVNTGGTVTVSNCFAVTKDGTSNGFAQAGGAMTCYHCSASGDGNAGFYAAVGTMTAYACVVQGTAADANFSGSFNGDFNVSEDSTAPGSASTKYARTETGWFENETLDSEDLALDATKQGWWAANKDAIDQTGWPSDVGTDIMGTARSAPIDPGVWQTTAAPGGSILLLVARDMNNIDDMGGTRG